MNISAPEKPFRLIPLGAGFFANGSVFVKMEVLVDNGHRHNAVCLADGCAIHFNELDPVKPIMLVVEYVEHVPAD